MLYSEPLFRPPSEAKSIIIQITDGCSYNKCKFCGMYKTKKYRQKSLAELKEHLDNLEELTDVQSKRAFLADGDALSMGTTKLLDYISVIRNKFPQISRFGIYGSVYSLRDKTVHDLILLKESGLKFIYLGLESGDEGTLKKMNKYMPVKEMTTLCQKVLQANLSLSVMIIIGLGGKEHSANHILNSARLINEISPTYTSLLNLMLDHTPLRKDPQYSQFNALDYINEVRDFVANVNCKTIFRSNHASNYVSLQGVFPRDKDKLLALLDSYSIKLQAFET